MNPRGARTRKALLVAGSIPLAALLSVASVIAVGTARAQEEAAPAAFLRTRDPRSGVCLHWTTRQYLYHYHSAGSSQTPGNAEFVAMEAAFDSWRKVAEACSDFTFEAGAMVGTALVGYDKERADNTNVITFRERSCAQVVPEDDPCWDPPAGTPSCDNKYQCWDNGERVIALTTSTFSKVTGVIFDSDIEFNAAPDDTGARFLFTTISQPPCDPERQSALCAATDIQNTLTHELGHVIGLDHVEVQGSTMEPTAPIGETAKRIIDEGTAAGFCLAYPKKRPSPPCEEVDEKIIAVNRGTPGLVAIGCSAVPGRADAGTWLGLVAIFSALAGVRFRGRDGRSVD